MQALGVMLEVLKKLQVNLQTDVGTDLAKVYVALHRIEGSPQVTGVLVMMKWM